MPGGSSTILYWPAPSVTAVRTFSINAGLDASTVTPGRTAPVASLTVPETAAVPCAAATTGNNTRKPLAMVRRTKLGFNIDRLLNFQIAGDWASYVNHQMGKMNFHSDLPYHSAEAP